MKCGRSDTFLDSYDRKCYSSISGDAPMEQIAKKKEVNVKENAVVQTLSYSVIVWFLFSLLGVLENFFFRNLKLIPCKPKIKK